MMGIPELGTLVEVNLREAWNHEAHSFTPWLAAHLDSLSNVIGIPLELEGREVAVETFSADILARNPLDNSLVLIENQLEGTDHTHLGQIMTYLAGLDAHTVVWIAADFREAHLSALKWLNEHTVDPFSFFAVKVKAVRIGNSPIAPIFEVLSRPNHWERHLQTIAQDTRQLSKIGQFRKAFWTHYVNRFPDEESLGKVEATSTRWRALQNLNMGDLKLVAATYVAQKEVGVFVRGFYNVESADVYSLLAPHAERLKELTGAELGSPGKDHFLISKRKGNPLEQGNWDELTDWLHSTVDSYESALRELLGSQD